MMFPTVEQCEIQFDSFLPSNPIPISKPAQPEQKKQYTKTDKAQQAYLNQIKQFDLSNVNTKYLEAFRNAKYPNYETDPKHKASWAQYKCSVGNLLESLNKDAVTITQEEIELFLSTIANENTRNNRTAHIKSFLSFILHKNISFSRQRTSSFVLVFADIVPEWFLNDKNIVKRLTGQ